jgi:hypothetical protein
MEKLRDKGSSIDKMMRVRYEVETYTSLAYHEDQQGAAPQKILLLRGPNERYEANGPDSPHPVLLCRDM